MQIVNNVALQFPISNTYVPEILSNIQRAEKIRTRSLLNESDLLVCWDYAETQRLAYLFDQRKPDDSLLDIPSPMLRDYTWPGFYTPFDHQKTTASFLSLRKRAFCFNEAGTGKTSAAIWAADYLMDMGIVKKVLIICPLSIMYTAWQADIFKTATHRTAAVAYGDRAKRTKVIQDIYDFTIINYDGVGIIRKEIAAQKFDLIIVDEANAYKNSSTKRWRALAEIITADTFVWMMTGTPAAQSPEDAFGLARVIAPHRIPKFKTQWRDRVMQQISRFTWIPRHNAQKNVHFALQPAIRFTKDECLDLPSVVYQTREIPLTPQVAMYYKRLRQQMLIEAAGQQISAVNAAASLSKLLQISGGAVYTDEHDVVEFDISPRLQALKEVLEETLHKVVVFVPFLHTIKVVTEFLRKEGYNTEIINGDVSAKNRAVIIDKFQRETDPRVLVIQPQSASHGVTLTAADTVVFWSPVLSVETYVQCVARLDRVTQKNTVTVVHLQGSDVERKTYKMLQSKVDSHQKLVDLYKQVVEE